MFKPGYGQYISDCAEATTEWLEMAEVMQQLDGLLRQDGPFAESCKQCI
jgi:hypothetical protein